MDQDRWKDDRKQQWQHRSIPPPQSTSRAEAQGAEPTPVGRAGRRLRQHCTLARDRAAGCLSSGRCASSAAALGVSPADLVREPRPGREEPEG